MDIFIGLIACIAAVFIGVFLAKQQARAFSSPSEGLDYPPPTGDGCLPLVNHFDYSDMRFLHLGSPAVQGSMKISKPYEIHLEYQQRMIVWPFSGPIDLIEEADGWIQRHTVNNWCYMRTFCSKSGKTNHETHHA